MVNQEIVKRIVGYAETYVSEAPDKRSSNVSSGTPRHT
jgi:hypothetical protein